MNGWNQWLAIISVTLLLLPLILIIYKKLYLHQSFVALFVYYVVMLVDVAANAQILPLPKSVHNTLKSVNNLTDTPLLLLYLIFFCTSGNLMKVMYYIFGGFLGYELLVIVTKGISFDANTYTLGPGILLVLCFAFYFFIQRAGAAFHNSKERPYAFLLASVIFAYVSYAIIYFFNFVLGWKDRLFEMYLVYYIASIVSLILCISGLLMFRVSGKELRSGHQHYEKPEYMNSKLEELFE
jgi:hypothetical protein